MHPKILPLFTVAISLIVLCSCASHGTPDATSKLYMPDFDAMWNYDDPAETENKFQFLVPTAKTSGDREYYLQLLTQIARAQGLQQKFAEAHKTLDKVEGKLSDKTPVARVRFLLERGRVLNSSGQPGEASPIFAKAFNDAALGDMDFYAVDAAHMMGIVEKGDLSIEWNEKALAIARQSKDERARNWRGSLLNNLGWTYFDLLQYDKALALFQEATQFRMEQGKPKEIRIARWCEARSLRALGRVETALNMQRLLHAELETAGKTDGYVEEEIGECLLEMGLPEKAAPHFQKAWEELSKDPWMVQNEKERLQRLATLGGL